MRRRLIFLLLFVPLAARPALAQSCILSVAPVVFGNYQPYATAPLDSTGRVTANCSDGVSAMVAMNPGLGGNFAGRRMQGPGGSLAYQLYANPAHNMVWGDGTAGSVLAPLSSSGGVTIYGRMPAGQIAAAGAYSDTILVTISF